MRSSSNRSPRPPALQGSPVMAYSRERPPQRSSSIGQGVRAAPAAGGSSWCSPARPSPCTRRARSSARESARRRAPAACSRARPEASPSRLRSLESPSVVVEPGAAPASRIKARRAPRRRWEVPGRAPCLRPCAAGRPEGSWCWAGIGPLRRRAARRQGQHARPSRCNASRPRDRGSNHLTTPLRTSAAATPCAAAAATWSSAPDGGHAAAVALPPPGHRTAAARPRGMAGGAHTEGRSARGSDAKTAPMRRRNL